MAEYPERTALLAAFLIVGGMSLRLAVPGAGTISPVVACLLVMAWGALLMRGRMSRTVALAAILASGYALMDGALRPPTAVLALDTAADRPCRLEGVVSDLPRGRRWGAEVRLGNLRVDTGSGPRGMRGEVRLRVWSRKDVEVRPGDLVRAEVELVRPPGRRSPGGADARLRLAAEGLHLRCDVEQGPLFKVIRGTVPPAWRWVLRLRESTMRLLSVVGQPEEGVLRALLLGDRRLVDERVEASLRASGLAHLLAVSGLHVGLVGLMTHRAALWLLRRWPALTSRCDARVPASWVGLAAAAAYTCLTGAALPTLRAFLALAVFFAAVTAERAGDGINSLCLAGMAILARWPAAVTSPSFQLSFAAAGSVLMISRLGPGRGRGVFGAAIVSAAAFLGTAPLAAYHFSRLAPAGVVASLLAVPLCGLIVLPSGLAASVLSVVWPAGAEVVILPASWGCRLLVFISGCLDGWVMEMGHLRPSPVQVAASLLVLASLPALRGRRGKVLMGVGLAVLLSGTAGVWPKDATGLRVTFMDVGQGDSTLVELAGGGRILVDAGPRFEGCDRGETVVVPCLRSRGVRCLDALVLTHVHPDHVGGAGSVLRNMKVKRIICPDRDCVRAAGVAAEGMGGPEVLVARAGERIIFPGGVMTVLAPGQGRTQAESENDRSLVFSVRTRQGAVLFTGDAGSRVLEAVARERAWDVKAGLVKVPHHGSRDSWSRFFYLQAAPTLGVISAGGREFYLPEPETSARIREMVPQVLETCKEGTVECLLTTEGMKVTTWAGGECGLSPHGFFHWLICGW